MTKDVQQPPRKPKQQSRYGTQHQVPSMATPRQPKPPQKSGFMGFIFVLAILGGMVWLGMMLFRVGPYQSAFMDLTQTPTPTLLPIISPGITQEIEIIATNTASPTVTATTIPTSTPTATVTVTIELLPFILSGEPEPMSSNLFRPGVGCDWLLIAGRVKDLQDAPVSGLSLHLFGELGGRSIDLTTLTGVATVYGESGYEFQLNELVVDSEGTLNIQLVDPNGIPLSQPYAIQTYADCDRNLILVNFKQVR